jgi:hypothetical protein
MYCTEMKDIGDGVMERKVSFEMSLPTIAILRAVPKNNGTFEAVVRAASTGLMIDSSYATFKTPDAAMKDAFRMLNRYFSFYRTPESEATGLDIPAKEMEK